MSRMVDGQVSLYIEQTVSLELFTTLYHGPGKEFDSHPSLSFVYFLRSVTLASSSTSSLAFGTDDYCRANSSIPCPESVDWDEFSHTGGYPNTSRPLRRAFILLPQEAPEISQRVARLAREVYLDVTEI